MGTAIEAFGSISSRSQTQISPNVRHLEPDEPSGDRMPHDINLIATIATLSSAGAITATSDIFQPINRGCA